MALVFQTIFSSLINGSVYALMGVAIVLCYRSSRVVNLAQGETYMVSGLLTAKLFAVGVVLPAAAACGTIAAGIGALLFERLALRSRLHWDPSRLIIVALGVALMVEGVANRLVGADQFSFPSLLKGPSLHLGGGVISQQGILLVAVTISVTVTLVWFLRRTILGQAMTASAENPGVSSLLGVNAARMRQLSYGLAGLLGGFSAVLLVPLTGITYSAGLAMTLNGFAAAAFAKVFHPGRAMIAGMLLGLGEGFVDSYVNPLLETPVVFGILLLLGVAYLSRNERFGGAVRA